MNKELIEALEILEKEKNISKATMLEAIENSLLTACKNHFGKADNVKVNINPTTGDFAVLASKEVVENVEDPLTQISLAEAKMIAPKYNLGDVVQIPIESKSFGRIATQNAKNVILQKIREEERKVLYNDWYAMEKDIVQGVVQPELRQSRCDLKRGRAGKRRGIPANRACESIRSGSKRQSKRTAYLRIQNSSRSGKTSV